MKVYQKIYAIIFLVAMLGFSAANIWLQQDMLIQDIKDLERPTDKEKLKTYTASIDGILTNDIYGGYFWNEAYGAVYAALGKNEENNFSYIKDKNGKFHFADFRQTNDTTALDLALRVARLKEYAEKRGSKVVFLLYPSRFDAKVDEGYYGLPYLDQNDFADDFLRYLRRYNIDYIDYREVFAKEGDKKDTLMRITDHHWKMETGFEAMLHLVDYMDTHYENKFDPNHVYTNPDNYVTEQYHKIYMGSMGRETGEVYAGLEDFTYITPVFETQFSRTFENLNLQQGTVKGDFNNTVMNKKYVYYEDVYQRELYNTYLGGIYRSEKIQNLHEEVGPKVLFLRDSYSSPVGAFLAPMCSQLQLYWTQHCSADYLREQMKEMNPDYIFVAFTPERLKAEDFTFFVEEEKADAKE